MSLKSRRMNLPQARPLASLCLMLGMIVAPAAADTTGYWRGESDANGGAGLEILNEVTGNSLTAPSASIDTNPANLPVGRIPRTGAVNTGSIDGDANISGTISEYAALNSDSITVEVFSRTLEGGGSLLSRTNNTDAGFSITDFSGYDVKYYVGAGTEVTINNVVNPNADWNYLAWTYDATEGVGRVYVDGQLAGTQTTATPGEALNWTGAGDISVGFDMDGGSLSSGSNTGIIDELRISNTALQTYQFLGAPALAVDFGTANQDVQTYFVSFDRGSGGDTGVNGPTSDIIDTPVGNYLGSDQVRVTIDSEGSVDAVDFRDRGDVSGSVGDIIEDQIKAQNSGIELTIEGLEAGVYKMTSWHHDANGATGGAAENQIDIFVTDALGALRQVIDDLATTGGTNPGTVADPSYAIYSNGVDPITIFFDNVGVGNNNPNEIVLNGFQLLVIPEPASMAMLAAGSLMLMRRRRA